MKEKLLNIWRWSRRYISLPLLIAVAYVVFILAFNDNSYFKSVEYQTEIDRLRAEIKENTDTMRHYQALNAELSVNPEALEKIVREQYHMQRPGEDVYVFD
ncbi:MAG: septum formation initiator family protein [Muribaculaceae bacterium]|nr:septum formation initiator family protein [Muribaculaceae bacterium]